MGSKMVQNGLTGVKNALGLLEGQLSSRSSPWIARWCRQGPPGAILWSDEHVVCDVHHVHYPAHRDRCGKPECTTRRQNPTARLPEPSFLQRSWQEKLHRSWLKPT